jgi:hypothetical protein
LFGRHIGETNPTAHLEQFRTAFEDFGREFDERNLATAAPMPREQAELFLKTIAEEYDICFEEHQRNPDSLYRRLGLHLTSTPPARPVASHRRQGFGELAARTAVRATVWELVFSLFRR